MQQETQNSTCLKVVVWVVILEAEKGRRIVKHLSCDFIAASTKFHSFRMSDASGVVLRPEVEYVNRLDGSIWFLLVMQVFDLHL